MAFNGKTIQLTLEITAKKLMEGKNLPQLIHDVKSNFANYTNVMLPSYAKAYPQLKPQIDRCIRYLEEAVRVIDSNTKLAIECILAARKMLAGL